MEDYDRLYRLYSEFDTGTLRAYQHFVDVFPAVDSRVALEYWEEANAELDRRKGGIRAEFPGVGETLADVAARATREQAFTALDLYAKHGRSINALVLDVDETLRSTGSTDNEIPREVLHLLTEFHDDGVPIVVCTGQTLENVKGFMIQGLGNGVVHSGRMSVVYEAGTGVFTPGHGSDTKQLLYRTLDPEVSNVFDGVRSRALSDAPETVREGCHLQGNEFNVTLKPNVESDTPEAREIVAEALVFLVDLVGETVAEESPVRASPAQAHRWARAHFATESDAVDRVLRYEEGVDADVDAVPDPVADLLSHVVVAHHEGDSAEIAARELDKAGGVAAALDVLGVDDPFVLVMGDSESDLRVMEWVHERGWGIGAAPDHADPAVREHVRSTDDLVFDRGNAADPLRVAYALNCVARLDPVS